MTSKEYINEFIQALELQLAQRREEPQKIPIVQMKLSGGSGNRIFYSIRLESTASLEDLELKLQIGDKKMDCDLVTFSPPHSIVISAREQISAEPGKMYLCYHDTLLLEALIERCKSVSNYDRFVVSERIFNGKPIVSHRKVQSLPRDLNMHQRAAAESSYGGDCMIWGPPGTGKTQTIAAAMTLHLEAGNRSLLLSHANTAVDGAFKRLAKTLKETDTYREGRMIRLGACDAALLQEFPLISLENVAEVKTKAVQEEMRTLQESLEELDNRRDELVELDGYWSTSVMEKEVLRFSDDVKNRENIKGKLIVRLEDAKRDLSQKRQEMEKTNASKFRHFFVKSPELLAREISELEIQILSLEVEICEAENDRRKAAEFLLKFTYNMRNMKKKLDSLLRKLNITEDQIKVKLEQTFEKIEKTEELMEKLEDKQKQIKKQILQEAVIVGTTLTKVYLSDELWGKPFECVFVDEVSMAPLPQLFMALSLAQKQCTLIGDFLQLPPINANIAKEKDLEGLGTKWLDRNIFQVAGLDRVSSCLREPYVSPLKTQYRMNPAIAGVVNELFYGRMLENGKLTEKEIYSDHWSGANPLILMDTSGAKPSAINNKGTINIYHANLAAHLAVSYLLEDRNVTVGVATQYRNQAGIIREMVRKQSGTKGFSMDRVTIDTIHRFQGGECDIIIYDSVESQGSAKQPWLLRERNPNIERLLNVAITRAKCKFILLANRAYAHKIFGESEPFRKVLDIVELKGRIVDSSSIDPYFRDVQDWMLEKAIEEQVEVGHYNETTFWGSFLSDIDAAQNRIVIFCPFLAKKRIAVLEQYFRRAVSRQVKIILITKETEEHHSGYQSTVSEILYKLSQYPIAIRQKRWMHHKIVLIDDRLVWEGSMNILSTYYTGEQMARIESEAVVKDISKCIRLTELI